MADRAQVEPLGFSSVFGVVMLMILVVSVTVYPAITDVQDHQRVSNVEHGMVSFADNVDDVVRSDARSRSTRLRLDRGQLALGAPVNLTVSGTNASGSSFSKTYPIQPLVYRSGEGPELVYVDGTVIRTEDGGAVVVREPRMIVSTQRLVLPVVQLQQGPGPGGVSGTTRVVTTETERSLSLGETTSGSVSLSVESPRATAWRRIFEDRGMTCTAPSPDTVTCSVSTDRVYVTLVKADVALRRV